MLRNIYMRIAYDGTDFHGWQTQPGMRTVQETIEQAVRRTVRHQVELVGSGRTDAGVHAAGQVANFLTSCPLPPVRLRHAIGSRLPDDISVVEVMEVNRDFHATRRAVSKLYRYRVFNTQSRPVGSLDQRYTYHFWHPLDLSRLREAARHFLGTMDFASMASKGSERRTTIRTVLRCEVSRYHHEVRIDVEGKGFLYNQVRNMVGTLLEIGRGHWEPDRLVDILRSADRAQAGPTVPARGLSLQWVRYPAALMEPPAERGHLPPPEYVI
jgi:tRNA pseudouridine38-40 synthase